MSLGYSAFGSQEWIRKLKPRRFFERRKTPAGEDGSITKKPDLQQLLLKNAARYETPDEIIKPFDRPSKVLPFMLLLTLALSIGAAIYYFLL